MQTIRELFQHLSNLPELVQWAGIFGLAAIVFSETGLLVGFFLPGDSLLVTAGLFAARGYLDIYWLLPALTVAPSRGIRSAISSAGARVRESSTVRTACSSTRSMLCGRSGSTQSTGGKLLS